MRRHFNINKIVLSLWFLSHILYSTHMLLESLSQLKWLFDRAKLLTQKLLKQGVCCARIEVIPSQVMWSSSRIDWPLWDVCVPNDNGPSTLPKHLLSPQCFRVRVSHLVFSFWCAVSVFIVVRLFCSRVCLCPLISLRFELRFGCLSLTYICVLYTDKI